MKLLLDESLPRDLATCFPDTFEIKTVPGMGWSGSENGKLLTLAADAGFKALITVDKNIEYQQNLDKTSNCSYCVVSAAQHNSLSSTAYPTSSYNPGR